MAAANTLITEGQQGLHERHGTSGLPHGSTGLLRLGFMSHLRARNTNHNTASRKSPKRNYTTMEEEGDKPFHQLGFLEGILRKLRAYLKVASN
jgi:hypothetical protein